MDFYMFLIESNATEVLNSSNGVSNIILIYVNGQVIVPILMLLNWSGTLSNKKSKSQCELENAVGEALNSLSLNVIQACTKKTQKVYQQFVL
jgi:hypothetical protein